MLSSDISSSSITINYIIEIKITSSINHFIFRLIDKNDDWTFISWGK